MSGHPRAALSVSLLSALHRFKSLKACLRPLRHKGLGILNHL